MPFPLNRKTGFSLGVMASLGAPLGWLVVSSFFGESKAALYFYLTAATAIAFGLFGFWFGILHERQELLANTDKLTGLDNRRAFLDKCKSIMHYCARKKQPVSLLFLDLDKFKVLNDTHGHEVGDMALRCFSGHLKSVIRETDIAARLGGDEFAVFLPGADQEQSLNLVRRIRQRFEQLVLENPKFVGLDISVGVHSPGTELASLEDLLEIADRAMYQEKKKKSAQRQNS